jgi:broad specificity phosphatase PhoE
MKIIFIRHSKTDRDPLVPITCWGLTKEGIELAEHLSHDRIVKDIDVLYASFQTKALETALLIAKPNAIPIKADDRLTEVTSFTRHFEPDLNTYTKNVHDYYNGDIPKIDGGETKREALSRFNTALSSIAETEGSDKTIGIVSHGNMLTLFASQYKEVDCLKLHAQIKQPDVAVFNWEKESFESFFGEVQ